MNKLTRTVAFAAVVAALYIALTVLSNAFGLASGPVQVRFSEALTILPVFMPGAIPGLVVGCFLSNLLTGAVWWDIVFGSAATLLGAVGTWLLRKKNRFLAPVPPIAANTLIVPFVIYYAYGSTMPLWLLFLTVFAGEFISAGILGELVYIPLKKYVSKRRDS